MRSIKKQNQFQLKETINELLSNDIYCVLIELAPHVIKKYLKK